MDLVSNFFRIQGGPTWNMYEYHVDFEPEIDFLSVRSALIRAHKDKIGDVYSFNGALLVSPKQLPEESNWQSKRESDGATINLRVRRTGEISPDSDEAVRILDIVIRQMQGALELKPSKRDFFDPKAEVKLPNFGLSIWPGYAMTITKYENELLLNMDIIHRVMRTDSAYDLMKRVHQEAKANNQDPKVAVMREITGQVVLTKYNNKTHTIDDILWPPDNTPKTTFDRRGEKISIADYMRVQYDIHIKDLNQPLLVTRPRKMNRRLKEEEGRVDKLVPELCYLTGMTDAQRSDFKLMKEFGEITRLNPQNRMRRYQDFGRRVSSCVKATELLSNWNLKLAAAPLRILGRQIDPIELTTAGQPIRPDERTAEWDRAVKNFSAYTPEPLVKWVLIFPTRDQQVAQDLASTLVKVAQGMGIQADNAKPLGIDNNRADGYKQACQKAAQLPGVRLIVCLLPRKDRQVYEVIKKYTLVDAGVPSQVISSLKYLLVIAIYIHIFPVSVSW